MKDPEPFDYTDEQLDGLLKRAKDQIEDKDYRCYSQRHIV
jgi:hypothetical protein